MLCLHHRLRKQHKQVHNHRISLMNKGVPSISFQWGRPAFQKTKLDNIARQRGTTTSPLPQRQSWPSWFLVWSWRIPRTRCWLKEAIHGLEAFELGNVPGPELCNLHTYLKLKMMSILSCKMSNSCTRGASSWRRRSWKSVENPQHQGAIGHGGWSA